MTRQVLIVDDLSEALDMLEQAVREAFGGGSEDDRRLPDVAGGGAQAGGDAPIDIVRADGVATARLQIAQRPFSLALVDLHLGDGHGNEVIAELAQRQPQCMVVVATIFDDDDHLFRALQAGAQGYVLKDRAPAWLATQLRGIDGGQPPLSPAIARRLIRHFQAPPVVADAGARADGGSAASAMALPPSSPSPSPAAAQTASQPRAAGAGAGANSHSTPPQALSRTSPAPADPLTPREREVLGLLAKGVHIADIARVLGISRHTVGDHVKNLYRKLNIASRAEAALEARERGLG
jgi:DNA-binding NarL/FixJ family response regulator